MTAASAGGACLKMKLVREEQESPPAALTLRPAAAAGAASLLQVLPVVVPPAPAVPTKLRPCGVLQLMVELSSVDLRLPKAALVVDAKWAEANAEIGERGWRRRQSCSPVGPGSCAARGRGRGGKNW